VEERGFKKGRICEVLRWQGPKGRYLLQGKPMNGGDSYEKKSKKGSVRWRPSKRQFAGPYVLVK
jgi:hypothetical protein